MKHAFLSATVLAVAAQSAFAADRALPPPRAQAPLYAPARVYDWSGFYVGINGGGGWGQSTYDFAGAGAGSTDVGVSGVLLGGTIPEADIPTLKKAGIAEIFLPGTSTQDIVAFVRNRAGQKAR